MRSLANLELFGKANNAVVMYSGYKLLLEKQNNQVKKNKFYIK